MSALGYEDSIPMIHVVGTNGKGSVASMVSCMIREHGLKVGLFTSPHLVDIRERMTVDGRMMSENALIKGYRQLMSVMDQHMAGGGDRATFFEVMFLLSLLHFSNEEVDVMIMEAGIGGLHDTTNVIENRWLNIITSISLDHTELLGHTIEAITKEKAGIIRPGIRTVAWTEKPEVRRIIEGEVRKTNGELVSVHGFNGDILERTKDAIDFSLYTKYYKYERMRIHTSAIYQLRNAALAVASVQGLIDRIELNPKRIESGLSDFKWPGRMEYVEPWLLVDGGHNLEGIKTFVDHLNTFETHGRTDILFACMRDKDHGNMCRALMGIKNLGSIYIPKLPFLRAVDFETMMKSFSQIGFNRVETVDDLKNFLDKKKSEIGTNALLGAVGSLYLVGEIKKYRGGQQ